MVRADRVRRALLKREPGCRVCALAGETRAAITVAPIVPLDQGGKSTRGNLQPVCARHAIGGVKAPALARILRRRLRQREAERKSKGHSNDR